jgi:hypothetical protein
VIPLAPAGAATAPVLMSYFFQDWNFLRERMWSEEWCLSKASAFFGFS